MCYGESADNFLLSLVHDTAAKHCILCHYKDGDTSFHISPIQNCDAKTNDGRFRQTEFKMTRSKQSFGSIRNFGD
jgi:hypothetical protein